MHGLLADYWGVSDEKSLWKGGLDREDNKEKMLMKKKVIVNDNKDPLWSSDEQLIIINASWVFLILYHQTNTFVQTDYKLFNCAMYLIGLSLNRLREK